MTSEWEMQATWDNLLRLSEHRTVDLDPNLPLRMVIGAKEGLPFFMIISGIETTTVQLSSAVRVERRRRDTDGLWALHLELLDPGLGPAFMRFCAGLVSRAAEQNGEPAALRAIYRAVDEFRRLLTLAERKVSSEQELKGILAELWLFRHLKGQLGEAETLNAWQGPYGAPKDFLSSDAIAHEAKAVGPQAKTVRISSAEQLDLDGLTELNLEVLTIAASKDGVTVGEAVASLEAGIAPENLSHFHTLIGRRMTTSDLNDEHRFAVVRRRVYRMDESFIAITPATVDPAITHVEYQVNLSSIADRLQEDTKLQGDGWN